MPLFVLEETSVMAATTEKTNCLFKTSGRTLLIAIAVFVFGYPTDVHAGEQNVDCRTPLAFRNAAVNAVVLPYTYAGAPDKPLSEAGRRLSVLLHRSVL